MLPDITIPPSLARLLDVFRPCFTAPSFRTFCACRRTRENPRRRSGDLPTYGQQISLLADGTLPTNRSCLPVDSAGMKSHEEIMEILEAYDLTGSYRGAAELVGCDHHTVARYVALRAGGTPVGDRTTAR